MSPNRPLVSNKDEKGRSYILSSRARKRRYEEMKNDDKDKKLSDLEKKDLLNAEILNMKNEIMTMRALKSKI